MAARQAEDAKVDRIHVGVIPRPSREIPVGDILRKIRAPERGVGQAIGEDRFRVRWTRSEDDKEGKDQQ